MKTKEIKELFWDYLHTVTLANENAPNEPHRQVIFKEEIPQIVSQLRTLILESLPKENTVRPLNNLAKAAQFGYNQALAEAREKLEEICA